MTLTDGERALILLDSFEELTYKIKRLLLNDLRSDKPDFTKLPKELIKSEQGGVYNKVEQAYGDEAYAQKIFDELDKKGVRALTYFSRGYPKSLKAIPSPPLVLYCRGNSELLKKPAIGVVGSRRTPAAIAKLCKQTAEEISENFAVVTGLADGADSAAAEGALKNKNAVCVLAYGFDFVYPAVNENLLKKVCENGLVITEHRPSVAPRSYLFPFRNRIIAALSQGVLVVSAGEKSGALITADYAQKYGKPLFAFPHNAGSALGAGCNALIKNGAVLAENAYDVTSRFGIKKKEQQAAKLALTESEARLLAAISELGEAHIEQIAKKLETQPFKLMGDLTSLEIKKAISRLGGNRYSALIKPQ